MPEIHLPIKSHTKAKRMTDGPIYCCVTGKEIFVPGGFYNSWEYPVSDEGVEVLINEYVGNYRGGGTPYWLWLLQQKFLRKKQRRTISKRKRQEILAKYKFKCCFCGSKERLEIDHIQPYSKGGTDELHNLQVLCKPCNLKKSDKV